MVLGGQQEITRKKEMFEVGTRLLLSRFFSYFDISLLSSDCTHLSRLMKSQASQQEDGAGEDSHILNQIDFKV